MADSDDTVPPIPTPPADLNDSPVVPPVEAAPVAPTPAAAPVEPAPATPAAAPAYGAPAGATPPPAQPGYQAQPGYPAQPGYAAQPGYPAQTGYAPYSAQPPGPPKGLSITSMVLGIVGIVFLGIGLLASVAAVITGHIAQRSQPYAKGFWLTGIITGYVGAGLALLFILFYVVIVVIAATSYNY